MEKQTTLGGGSPTCKRGERAGIIVAHDEYIGFEAGLIARAVLTGATANHEYGLPGRETA